ncbi:MAG TPA: hypothetical protein VF796_13910 [Humisphaera sp.]
MSGWAHGIEFSEVGTDDVGLFYGWVGEEGSLEIRPRYRTACCKRCGKLDPRSAAKLGFDGDLWRKPPRKDLFATWDLQIVASDRAVKAFDRCFPGAIDRWALCSGWSFVMPRNLVFPHARMNQAGDIKPAFWDGMDRCPKCRRWAHASIDEKRVLLPDGERVIGYWGESDDCACPNVSWVCDDASLTFLRAQKLIGMRLQRNEYGPGAKSFRDVFGAANG